MEPVKEQDDLQQQLSQVLMKPANVNFVIYHAKCSDGTWSAMAARYLLGDKAVYHPAAIGAHPPDVKDKYVAICDYSYNKTTLEKMINDARGLVVLDHHDTSAKDLKEIHQRYKVFTNKHSGAYISWMYFNPTVPVPKVITTVEDYDIWNTHKVEEFKIAKDLHAYHLSTNLMDYKKLEALLTEEGLTHALTIGKSINAFVEKQVNDSKVYGVAKMCRIYDKYYIVMYKQNDLFRSELGNELLKSNPDADFSVVYSYTDKNNSSSFSFRSMDDRADVGAIAKKFGGGGHRNSSGAKFPGNQNQLPVTHYEMSFVLDTIQSVYNKTIMAYVEFNKCRPISFVMLNTNQYPYVWAEYLGLKLSANVCVWYKSKHNYIAQFWMSDGMNVDETATDIQLAYDNRIFKVLNKKVSSNKPMFELTFEKFIF